MPVLPQDQGPGQALGDLFGGVNRPQLNSFVATSQARNGLVSAQTQDALIKAAQAQEQMAAHDKLKDYLVAAGAPDSEAMLAYDFLVGANNNDPVTALKALSMAKLGYGNAQSQTGGQQMFEGKLAAPVATPNTFQAPPGSVLANAPVQQTPQGAAQTADTQSQTALRNAQAAAGGFNPNTGGGNQRHLDPVMAAEAADFIRQNPNLATNFRSLLSNGGPDVIHAFLHPNEGAAPSAPVNGVSPAPGVSLAEQAAIRKDFASGTAAKQSTSLNTMVQHSQLFDAIADQMQNGNFTPTNYISQLWQRTFGSPVPTNLQIAGDFLGREAVRATVNAGAGTGAERELAVTPSSSPDALHGAAATLRSLAAGQLHSLDLRAQRGGVDIAQLLGPEAQAVFGRHPVAVTAPQGAPGSANTSAGLPSYPDEASALAAGHKAGDRVMIGGVSGTLQ
jgi:hypothetical protein